jgi:3-hydroxyisobutyrate dehydrogenase-like beta-hydroxyacid dehydrogenase
LAGDVKASEDMRRVAVIGTGRMGAAMVGRLRGASFDVVVYNRTTAKATDMAERFAASVAPTPREAVEGADAVLVSLADDAALRDTYGGNDGIITGLRSGTVIAEASTVTPETVKELAARVRDAGGEFLDAPVSGSVSTVEQGGLTIMVGGDAAALERVRPVLAALATRIVLLGPVGSGAVMKLAVNSVVFALNGALAEALVLAEQAGLDREMAYDVLAGSAVGAPFVQYKRAAFLTPDKTPVAFSLDLVAKDLDLVVELADSVNAPMPQSRTNRDVVEQAVAAGLGHADMSSVAKYLRDMNVT